MVRAATAIIALAAVALGVSLTFVVRDAPARKLWRVLTVEHRCLVCNEAANRAIDYGEHFTTPHRFCHRHDPPDELWFMFWPEVDKYATILMGLAFLGGGTVLSGRALVEALDEGAGGLLVGAAAMYGFGWFQNQFVWIVNT